MNNKIKMEMLKRLSGVAAKEVEKSISTCCLFVCHQPKIPDKVKQLKNK